MDKYLLFLLVCFASAAANAELFRDPTMPLSYQQKRQATNFDLQAIFSRDKSFSAIVNGKTLHLGDHFDGWQVSGIDRHSVTFSKGGESMKKSMWSNFTK